MPNRYLLCLLIIANAVIVSGQDTTLHRPTVGLVLSGGGAKGLAHIGVLKVLEEAGLPIDYIGGTSMGSIVGGLYAIGYNADELEHLALTRDWNRLLTDEIVRREVSFEEKEDQDRFFISFPFRGNKLQLPPGVISAQNIENLLNKLCAHVYWIRDFNKFQIPYLCVAVDIFSGEDVIFRDGYLPEAIRASIAIPSILEPVEIDGKIYVDGGLINNFPILDVKNMGADLVIGVNVGFQPVAEDKFTGLFRVFEQTLYIATQQNEDTIQKYCNYYIHPNLEGYNSSNFNTADSIIMRGEMAARSFLAAWKTLADSLNNIFSVPFKKPFFIPIDSINIEELTIHGLDRVSEKLLTGKLQLKVPGKYTPDEIASAIDRAYSSLYFNKVTYRFDPVINEMPEAGTRLVINVKEKEGGQFRVGLNYNTDFKSSLVLNATFRNALLNGSKLSGTIGLGENPFYAFSYFKNNGWKPGLGIDLKGESFRVFAFENAKKSSVIKYSNYMSRIYLQSIIRNSYALGGGIEYEYITLRPEVGDLIDEKLIFGLYNAFGFIHVDTYDNLFYPTRGNKVDLVYKFINSPDINPTHFINFRCQTAIPLANKISLIPSVYAGFTTADSSLVPYLFFLGGLNQGMRKGLMPFTGLEFMQVADRNAAVAGIALQYNIWKNNYIILKANAGNTSWEFYDLFNAEKGIIGYGITLGNNSMIGPIEISLMGSNLHKKAIGYVNIGYWF